jgi:hypothetical protein
MNVSDLLGAMMQSKNSNQSTILIFEQPQDRDKPENEKS